MYRGRFAPSPTGPLHFGSLVAACASYLDCLAHKGEWLLRIEDIDEGRCSSKWITEILKTLEKHGFVWSEPPVLQSARLDLYTHYLNLLWERDAVYYCECPRSFIKNMRLNPHTAERIYDGTCAFKNLQLNCPQGLPKNFAIRARVQHGLISFVDRFCGPITENLWEQCGDFIIQRSDGYFAYQFVVVIDDFLQEITHVVRGQDLLFSTPRQIALQKQLGFFQPSYAHIPVVKATDGKKLSKQNAAPSLDCGRAAKNLLEALQFLGCPLPHMQGSTNCAQILEAGAELWLQNT